MGSVGMGRAPISVAVSGPSPAALSPHETVSLTIQLIYPEELLGLFQYRSTLYSLSGTRTQSHIHNHRPRSTRLRVRNNLSLCTPTRWLFAGRRLPVMVSFGLWTLQLTKGGGTHRQYKYLVSSPSDLQCLGYPKYFATRIVPILMMNIFAILD